MNRIILKGRLTADVELRQTQSGVACCRFTLAVNRRFKNKNTGEYEADFISCQAWRQQAEFLSRYVTRGQEILIEGTLQTGKYQDKKYSDVTHYTSDVVVENVEFCGKRSENESTQPSNNSQPASSEYSYLGNLGDFEEIISDGDMPF